MTGISRKIDKIALIAAIGLCGAVFFGLILLPRDKGIDMQLPDISQPVEMPDKEKIIQEDSLLAKLGQTELFDSYSGIKQREIFSEYKSEQGEKKAVAVSPQKKTVFSVLNIEPKMFPLEYKGCVKGEGENLTAQINWRRRTYFVEKGGIVSDYNVIKISAKEVSLEHEKTKEKINLLYLTPIASKELTATVMDMTEKRVYEVEKGMTIGDYNVLDISSDSVILSKGKEQLVLSMENR